MTGAVGGTVTVGNLEIGRPIPIDIQIPRASSMTSLSGDRQASTVKDSFKATPRKLGSDNETGGRHRAPLREAVANIKNRSRQRSEREARQAGGEGFRGRLKFAQQELVEDAIVFDRKRLVERHARIRGQIALGGF